MGENNSKQEQDDGFKESKCKKQRKSDEYVLYAKL